MLFTFILRLIQQSAIGRWLISFMAGSLLTAGVLGYLHNRFTAGYRAHVSELSAELRRERKERVYYEQEVERLKMDYAQRLAKYQQEVARLLQRFLSEPPYRIPANGTTCEKLVEMLREYQRRNSGDSPTGVRSVQVPAAEGSQETGAGKVPQRNGSTLPAGEGEKK